jgi:hypothetical protein
VRPRPSRIVTLAPDATVDMPPQDDPLAAPARTLQRR